MAFLPEKGAPLFRLAFYDAALQKLILGDELSLNRYASTLQNGTAVDVPRIEARTVAEHREAVWERLRDGFLEALREEGYAALTLASVAKRAGVARNTIYNYAQTKDALLVAVVEGDIEPFVAELLEQVKTVHAPDKRLELIVAKIFEDMLTPLMRGIYVSSSLASAVPAPVNAALKHCFEPINDVVAQLIRQGVREGRFRPVANVDRTVARMISVMQVSHTFILEGEPADAIAEETTRFFLSALGMTEEPKQRPRQLRAPRRR